MGDIAVLASAGGFVEDGHAAPDGEHRTPYDQHPAAFVHDGVGKSAELTEDGVGKPCEVGDLETEIRRFGEGFRDARFPYDGLLFGHDQHDVAVGFRDGLPDEVDDSGGFARTAASGDVIEHFFLCVIEKRGGGGGAELECPTGVRCTKVCERTLCTCCVNPYRLKFFERVFGSDLLKQVGETFFQKSFPREIPFIYSSIFAMMILPSLPSHWKVS